MSQSFQNGVVQSGTFRDFAYENFEPVLVDLSKRSRSDRDAGKQQAFEELRSRFAVADYPTVVVVSSAGRHVQSVVGYDRKGPHIYVRDMKEKLAGLLAENP